MGAQQFSVKQAITCVCMSTWHVNLVRVRRLRFSMLLKCNVPLTEFYTANEENLIKSTKSCTHHIRTYFKRPSVSSVNLTLF